MLNKVNLGINNSAIVNFKADNVKSDLVTEPDKDEFQTQTPKPKKKKHTLRNVCLGLMSAAILTYGGIVLKRKLSKPSFEEVQKCFQEIFNKDLSGEEVKALIEKYKNLCKNRDTENFAKKLIETLKKDYGIEQVSTEVNISKLKDTTLKAKLEQTEFGQATPLGDIKIMPPTGEDFLIRSTQHDTFKTGFHELKHIKQFSEAYRANPDKFAEAIYNRNFADKIGQEQIAEYKKVLRAEMEKLKETDPDAKKCTIDELMEIAYEEIGGSSDEAILNKIKKEKINGIRKLLDERYGKLEPFKEGTEEYRKGMEYIKGYEEYPDYKADYDAYLENILEKEAWNVGDLAQKIHKYTSSIWKI